MVAWQKLLRWGLLTGKIVALLYGLVLGLTFLMPDIRLDPELEDMLYAVFASHKTAWVWSGPAAWIGVNMGWLLLHLLRQAWVNYRLHNNGVVRVLLPRVDANIGAKEAVQFWNQVSDLIPKHQHITFELAGSSLGVNFALCADAGANRALIMQAMADWPGTQSRPVETAAEDPLFNTDGQAAFTIVLRPAHRDKPIQTAVADVLAAPLVEISRLPDGVKGGLLVLVRGDSVTRSQLGAVAAKETAEKSTGKSLERKRAIKAADSRAQHIFLEVRLLIWAAAGSEKMARSVARSLARSVKAQYESSNPLETVSEKTMRPRRVFPLFTGRPWTDAELATLAHLEGATGSAMAPQLETAPSRPLPPAPDCRIPAEAHTVIHLAAAGGEG
jgi:hypothetical protein